MVKECSLLIVILIHHLTVCLCRPVTSPTPLSQAGSVTNLSQRSSRHNTLEKKR